MILIGVSQKPNESTVESKQGTIKVLIIISVALAVLSFTIS